MDMEEFSQMSLEEIYAFQQENKAKLERNKQKIKEAKEKTKRLIRRGQIASEVVPGGSLEQMDEERFLKELCRLIYHS